MYKDWWARFWSYYGPRLSIFIHSEILEIKWQKNPFSDLFAASIQICMCGSVTFSLWLKFLTSLTYSQKCWAELNSAASHTLFYIIWKRCFLDIEKNDFTELWTKNRSHLCSFLVLRALSVDLLSKRSNGYWMN